MIRHNVEDQSHAQRLHLAHACVELFFRPDLRIQRVVIGDVVSVQAAGARLQHWREITMGDSELIQIGQQPPRIFKTKSCVQLQTVGADGTVLLFLIRDAIETLGNFGALDRFCLTGFLHPLLRCGFSSGLPHGECRLQCEPLSNCLSSQAAFIAAESRGLASPKVTPSPERMLQSALPLAPIPRVPTLAAPPQITPALLSVYARSNSRRTPVCPT